VIADKPASRGEGRILRLYTLTEVGQAVEVSLRQSPVREAWLCDSRERDLHSLEVRNGSVHVTMPGTIASLRLRV
jgi:alpha-mannosidase